MGSKEKRKRQAHNVIKKTQPAQIPSLQSYCFRLQYNYPPISILKLVMTIVINLFPFLQATKFSELTNEGGFKNIISRKNAEENFRARF